MVMVDYSKFYFCGHCGVRVSGGEVRDFRHVRCGNIVRTRRKHNRKRMGDKGLGS